MDFVLSIFPRSEILIQRHAKVGFKIYEVRILRYRFGTFSI